MMQTSLCSKASIRGGALRSAAARRPAGRRLIAAAPRAAVTVPEKFKTVKPAGDRVYVKLGAQEEMTSSGILLPSSAVARSNEGEVVSVGKDASLKEGEQVLFAKYAGTEVAVGDDEFLLLKEDDILGTMPSNSIKDLKPTGSRVLLQVYKAAEESKGGVMLGTNTEQPTIGKVVAAGPGKEDAPMTLSAGQDVMYSKFAGMELEGDLEEKYVVINEMDVLAVLS